MGVAIQLVRFAAIGVGIVAAAAPAFAQGQQATGRSVTSGVYTTEQAAQGEKVFQGICENCHETSQFTSAAFHKTWSGRPLFSLFDQIRTAMPMDNPGGLSRAEYLAVITYILKLNGLPAGTTELPDDEAELKQILLDALAGSKD
jgi:mono/diheme cytochrome c family protein